MDRRGGDLNDKRAEVESRRHDVWVSVETIALHYRNDDFLLKLIRKEGGRLLFRMESQGTLPFDNRIIVVRERGGPGEKETIRCVPVANLVDWRWIQDGMVDLYEEATRAANS